MFYHDTLENRTGIIRIKEADPEIVEAMLKFMYSGQVEKLNEIAGPLFIVADRYNVKQLRGRGVDSNIILNFRAMLERNGPYY
jgi:hypothetical protein